MEVNANKKRQTNPIENTIAQDIRPASLPLEKEGSYGTHLTCCGNWPRSASSPFTILMSPGC